MCYEQSGGIDLKILLFFVKLDTLIYFSPKEFVMDNKHRNLISLSDQLLLLVDVDCQRCLYLSLTKKLHVSE